MISHVRKLVNTSNVAVPVDIDQYTRVYVAPGEVIENKNILNLGSIRQFCKVEEDLGEINPIKEGKQYLKG